MSGELAKALVAAQKAMPAVDKTGRSNFGAHVTLDHLIAKTRQHLADNGLAMLQFPTTSETGQPQLRTTLLHTSGEALSADMPLLLDGKHTMQALGAAITYARRQGWSSVLGISTEQDDDGDSVSAPKEGASQPAPAKGRDTPAAGGTTPPAAPPTANGSTDEFRFASGKHMGKTLAEAPRNYVEWACAEHPKPEVREMCSLFLNLEDAALVGGGAPVDDDIPFDRTA